MSLWQEALARAREKNAERRQHPIRSEMDRILALPRVDYFAMGDYTPKIRRPGAPKGFMSSRGEYIDGLNANQSAFLHAVEHTGGAIGAIAVGGGKAASALLSGVASNADLTIVLCPPSTKKQLFNTLAEWRHIFKMPKVVIYSYDKVSRDPGVLQKAVNQLGKNGRVMLACDEVHALANADSARTRRVQRFLENNPEVMFCGLSGTITSKSLRQMAHLFEWALKDKSPLPMQESDYLDAWANCVDVKGRPGQIDWFKIDKLVAWAKGVPVSSFTGEEKLLAARESLAERLRTAPGVVATTGGAIGTSLVLEEVDGPPVTTTVAAMLADVLDRQEIRYIDEDGRQQVEILTDDASIWRAGRTLSLGFCLVWDWPKKEDGRPIIDHDWLDARADWNAMVRSELKEHATEGYDSPGTIRDVIAAELAAGRASPIHDVYAKWLPHSKKRWDGQPTPPTKAIWIDDTPMQYVVDWAKKHKTPTIFWYHSQAVRDKLVELGFPGPVVKAGDPVPKRSKQSNYKHIALSIPSHGTGLNLQDRHSNFVIEPPSGGKAWEQMLARTHRPGQTADEVECWVLRHTEPFKKAMEQAFKDARYMQTLNGEQKLLYATLNFKD